MGTWINALWTAEAFISQVVVSKTTPLYLTRLDGKEREKGECSNVCVCHIFHIWSDHEVITWILRALWNIPSI